MRKKLAVVVLSLVCVFASMLVACAKKQKHEHTLESKEEISATCTEDGNIAYWHCIDCDKYFSDAAANTEISRTDTIKAKTNHPNLKHVAAKEASCKEAGFLEHWYCDDCKNYFGNSAATEQKTLAQVTIPTQGHKIGPAGYCSVCGKFEVSGDIDLDIVEPEDGFYTMVGFITNNATSKSEIEVIPESYNGKPVRVIGGCTSKNLVTLFIPKSITKILESAFDESANPKLENIYYGGTIADWCKIELEGSPMYSASHFYIRNADDTEWVELTDLVIPDSVTKIAKGQFANFGHIERITFGSGLTEIGDYAFSGCNSLSKIEFPANVQKIGNSAFYGCNSVATLSIGSGVTEIGNHAFANLSELKEIVIPDTITKIDNGAFQGCRKVTTLTVGAGITECGDSAFADLTKLTTLNFNLNTAPTGSGVFINAGKDADTLELNFGANVTVIPKMFGGLKIGVLTIGENVTSIGDSAFKDCEQITQINYNAINATAGAEWSKTSFSGAGVPDVGAIVNIGAKVTDIPNYLFSKTNIKELNFAEDGALKTIGAHAFDESTLGGKLVIPEGVTSIGANAFYDAELTGITVPSTVTTIGSEAFACVLLEEINYNAANAEDFDESVSEYSPFHGAGGASATEVCVLNIGAQVTKIPTYFFRQAFMTSIKFAEGSMCTSIGNKAFLRGLNLESVTFPDSLLTIGDYAFSNCDKLKGAKRGISTTDWGLTIPKSVTSVGDGAFRYCDALEYVSFELNSNCKTIGDDVFYNCENLKSVAFPQGLQTMGESVLARTEVQSVSIPFVGASATTDNARQPFGYLFGKSSNNADILQYYYDENGQRQQQRYLIPESIQSIYVAGGDVKSYAFYGLNLTNLNHSVSISLGTDVQYVDAMAFTNCTCSTYNTHDNNGLLIPYGNDNKYALIDIRNASAGITVDENVALIADNVATIALTSVSFNWKFNGTVCDGAFEAATEITYLEGPTEAVSQLPFPQTQLSSLKINGGSKLDVALKGCDNLTEVDIKHGVQVESKVFSGVSTLLTLKADSDVIKYFASSNPNLSDIVVYSGDLMLNDYSIFGSLAKVEYVTLEYGVTGFTAEAFKNFKLLKSVSVAADHTELASVDGILYNKDKTELLLYPAKKSGDSFTATDITKVGAYAFYGNTVLETLVLPSTVTEIGEKAFAGCTSLVNVTVPFIGNGSNIKYFNYLFGGTSTTASDSIGKVPESLETVTVLNGTEVAEYAFYGLSSIKSVTLPTTVTSIGANAFTNCTALEAISIPAAVTGIGNYAFSYCTNLANVTVPQDSELTSIGTSAFSGCSKLTSVTIPEKVTAIGDGAFQSLKKLTAININAANLQDFSVTKENNVFTGAGAESDGIDVVFGNKVTNVPSNLFYSHNITTSRPATDFAKVKSITFAADGVQMKIGYRAFYGFSNITSLELPAYVTEIGGEAFYGWSGVESLTLGNTITYVGSQAFGGMVKLAEITYNVPQISATNQSIFSDLGSSVTGGITVNIGADVKLLPDYFIVNATKVTSVTFANDSELEGIGNFALNGTSITAISLPATLKTIGASAFAGSKNLEEIDLSETAVQTIGNNAFYGCTKVTDITLPETLSSIGQWAFRQCDICELVIPQSVTEIGFGVVQDCTSLEKITTPVFAKVGSTSNETQFSSMFGVDKTVGQNLSATFKELTVTGTITELSEKEFYNLKHVTKIVLPNTITKIGKEAFYGCESLASVNIPEGVTSIGDFAFHNCCALTDIYFDAINCGNFMASNNVFRNVGKNNDGITLHIGAKVTVIPANIFNAYVDARYSGDVIPNVTEIIVDKDSVLTTVGADAFKVTYMSTNAGTTSSVLKIAKLTIPAEKIAAFSSVKSNWIYYLTEVVVNGGSKIPDYAFQNFTELTSVTLEEGVVEIGKSAFYGCADLENLTLPTTLTTIGADAFTGCTKLLSEPENGATYIGGASNKHMILMQAENTDITSVTIHEDTKYINSAAFENCKQLAAVTIPEGVLSIGNYAFAGCVLLTQITIPDSVVSIGSGAFGLNANTGFVTRMQYTSVTIGKGVKSIGQNAFTGSNDLEDIYFNAVEMDDVSTYNLNALFGSNTHNLTLHIGAEVKRIPAYLCGNNDSGASKSPIVNLVFAENGNLEEIGAYAFSECETLTGALQIPASVKTIGAYAFNKTGITSVELANGNQLESIGESAFKQCSSLATVTVGEGTNGEIFGKWAFFSCSNLKIIVNLSELDIKVGETTYGYIANNASVVTKSAGGEIKTQDSFILYESETEIIVIGYEGTAPETLTLPSVTGKRYTVGPNAFNGKQIKNIVIPDAVSELGDSAFQNNLYLTSLTLGSGLKTIGANAFKGCSALTSVVVPNSVESIGAGAFDGCKKLVNITLGSGVKTLDGTAFDNGASSVTLNITDIKAWCELENGSSISHSTFTLNGNAVSGALTIPEGTAAIANYAFSGCTGITSVTVSNGVTSIGRYAFNNCTGLKSVSLADSVETIKQFAFYGCSQMNSISLGNGLKNIELNSFFNCSALTTINLPDSLTDIDSSAFNTVTATLVWGENPQITIIGSGAFAGYKGTSFTVPESVTSIGDRVFNNCSNLTSVTIGKNVTTIGTSAFGNCKALTSINFDGTVEEWGAIVKKSYWNDNTGNYTVHCTDGTVAK